MTSPTAATLPLVGGALAFDFANTAAGRDTPAPFQHIRTPEDLAAWAAHAGCIDAATASRLAEALGRTDEPLREALALREAIYRLGAAIACREPPADRDLRIVRNFARLTVGIADLAPQPSGGYGFDFRGGPPEIAVLGPIVWSALDLLATADFRRVRQCTGEGCGWLFLDRSKNNSRRWCDMATCGNRTKGRRHRHARGVQGGAEA